MVFSTPAANDAFKSAFTVPATAVLSPPVESADSKELYTALGQLWAAGHRAVQALEGVEQHQPAADSSLKEDVAAEVEATLDGLWFTHKPKIGGVGSVVPKRMNGTMSKAYDVSMRGAAAHAAAAADRAAAAPFGGIPIPTQPIHSPAKADGALDAENDGADLDIVDILAGRIRSGVAAGEFGEHGAEKVTGNAGAAETMRAVAVSPGLARAAKRLVAVGCPPLRVEKRYGSILAEHLLKSKPTFTDWAETRGLAGAPLREALTIARALDLATEHQGASYLTSPPAEVQLRRLYSVCLAAKLGSYRLSQHLEEVPGDGALAELPASIMREMSEAMKLEMKIEQMMNGK